MNSKMIPKCLCDEALSVMLLIRFKIYDCVDMSSFPYSVKLLNSSLAVIIYGDVTGRWFAKEDLPSLNVSSIVEDVRVCRKKMKIKILSFGQSTIRNIYYKKLFKLFCFCLHFRQIFFKKRKKILWCDEQRFHIYTKSLQLKYRNCHFCFATRRLINRTK